MTKEYTIKNSVRVCLILMAMLSCNEYKIKKENISLILQPHGKMAFYDTIHSIDIVSINYEDNNICISDTKKKEVDSIMGSLAGTWANLKIGYKGDAKYAAAIFF